MFYNTYNVFKMGEFVVNPILMFTFKSFEFELPKLVKPSIFDATVIIAGISIVVAVLVLLIYIFQLFGAIVPKIEKASKAREEKRKARKAAKKAKKAAKKARKNNEADSIAVVKSEDKATDILAAPAPSVAPPAVEEGISTEVVAAITAAIVASEGSNVIVRSIKKKNVSGRNPWAQAANIDNTRPF